ncbi:MAG: DUF1080 domain-containing protein [Pirellulales bacterium]|nr:DUF1080 domain-containing protein [Pirellulales bacterium]
MIRRRLLLSIPIISAWMFAGPGSAFAGDDKLEPIFNGKTLDGWVIEGNKTPGIWNVTEDGELYCKGKGFGFLRYDKKLCDFEITLEYKMGPNCNSGIGIRGAAYTSHNKRPSVSGYELQILADQGKNPSRGSSMSLYRLVAPKVNATRAAGEWNTFKLICRGPQITVTLNDQVVHDFDQTTNPRTKDKPLCGYFSVQNHNKDIWYRNIRLRELTPKPR